MVQLEAVLGNLSLRPFAGQGRKMASILTNKEAALGRQALAAAARDLETARNRLATGKKVATAKDNGSIFGIATNMRSEANGWGVVSDSLNRGQSILDVAATGAATIADCVSRLKELALAYSDTGYGDASKEAIKQSMLAITKQIDVVARTAMFDGVNLLAGPVGNSAQQVSSAQQAGPTLTISSDKQVFGLGAWCPLASTLTSATYTSAADGSVINLGVPPMYPAPGGDQHVDWLLSTPLGPGTYSFTFAPATGYYGFDIQELGAPPAAILTDPRGSALSLNRRPMTSADLGIDPMDWTDPSAVQAAVSNAQERVVQSANHFGGQQNLVSTLMTQAARNADVIEQGVGNIVDADLGKESAKLRAGEAKVGLATQVLSIANAMPQWIVGLFRPG